MIRNSIQLLLAFLFLVSVAAGQSLTALDVARTQMVADADISPDGRYIAYTLWEPRDPSSSEFKNGPMRSILRLYDVKTKRDSVFIGSDENLRSVKWSSDSSFLTFLSKRNGDKHTSLYRISVDGGEAERVLSFTSAISNYSIAPDGSRVAFIATPAVSDEKKEWKEKGFNQEIVEEEWRNAGLYLSRLGSETSTPVSIEGHISDVTWSPQPGDDRLLIIKADDPSVDAYLMYRKVCVVSLQGEELAALDVPGKLGLLEWSPDGKKIAMTAGVDINDPDNAVLFVADSATGKTTALTAALKGRVDSFSWKASDLMVAAVSVGAHSKLMNISTSGKLSDATFTESRNYLKVDISDNGVLTAVADSPTHPRELFLNDRRITDSNPWLKNRELAEQKVVTYRAKDGLEIEGILISPQGATGPSPTIIVVHGGPESHYDNGWLTGYSMPGQLAAAQGYAVFHPNYRGSTGRGTEFTKSSQADPAGKEFDDVIDAIDYLIAEGITDKDKVGVTGGSYGGYATGWLATRYSDRVAAGVMFVGISDKISKVGTTDIADEEYHVHTRMRPWEDFELFLDRSPIRHVEKGRTPLLIMHGKDDPRVHPTQSMELFRFLKILNQAPVRLVLYPGEGHGNRLAAARYDYNLRMMRWFDTYLKGDGTEKPPVEVDYQL